MKPHSTLRTNIKLRRAAAASFALVGLMPAAGLAQAIKNEVTVQRFDPAPGPRNFFVTRTARTDGNKTWSAGFYGGFASQPLVVVSCISSDCSTSRNRTPPMGDVKVIETMVAGDLLGSFTVIPPLQIGLRVPI